MLTVYSLLMNPFDAVRRAFRPGGTAADQLYSIVLLERHHHFLRKETLREAAERAYGHSFAPGNADYSVTQSTSTFVKAGEDTIHITQSSSPHEGHPNEVEMRGSNHHVHPHAWQEHKGYIALDLWNRNRAKLEAYRVLSKLSAALLVENVVGIYLPRDNEFYANDGAALERLKHFAG